MNNTITCPICGSHNIYVKEGMFTSLFGSLKVGDTFWQIPMDLHRINQCTIVKLEPFGSALRITYHKESDPQYYMRHVQCDPHAYVLRFYDEYLAADEPSALTALEMIESDLQINHEGALRTISTMREMITNMV